MPHGKRSIVENPGPRLPAQDEELICWDVRYSPGPVYRMSRPSGSTNQRIQFDIEPCGRLLGTGGQAGKARADAAAEPGGCFRRP